MTGSCVGLGGGAKVNKEHSLARARARSAFLQTQQTEHKISEMKNFFEYILKRMIRLISLKTHLYISV